MGINRLNELKFQEKLKLAASYESLENYLHAIQIYTALINEDESYIDTYISFVSLYERMDRIPEAVKVIDRMVKSNPENEYAFLFSAEFYIHYSYWSKALDIIPKIDCQSFPIVDYWFGICYFNLKEFNSARVYLKNFSIKNIDADYNFGATLLLAKVEYELNNFQIALDYAEKILYFDSENRDLNLLLARIYYKLDMYNHAAQNIEKALKNKKNDSAIIEQAAKIFYKSGELKKAEKLFNLLFETTDQISAEVYYYIGAIANANEQFDKALYYFEFALKIEPDFRPAIESLRNLILQTNKKAKNE